MKFSKFARVAFALLFLAFIVGLWWNVSRIGLPEAPKPSPSKNPGAVEATAEPQGAADQEAKPSISLPIITAFRKELGIREEDIRKLVFEDDVLWRGYDPTTSAHRLALFIKPDPDVEVGEHYYIYPVTERSGQSSRTVSPSFREASRNKILVASIGTSQADHMKLSKPDEGRVLFGHDYTLCWYDLKGPAGEIQFRTPDGPEEGVKDYSMDLILTADGLYPKKE